MKTLLVKQPKPPKPDMERFTLYLTVDTANDLRVLSSKNRRSVAWILREYAAVCVKNADINNLIGIIRQ